MRVVDHVALRTAGKSRVRNRLALGGAALPPGLPSAPLPPLRAEAFHCRQADNRMQTQKASKLRRWI